MPDGDTHYTVPDEMFVDEDGDALVYGATRIDGGTLPAWLTFDAETRTFTVAAIGSDGIEGGEDAPVVEIRLVADDGRGGTAALELTFARPPALGAVEPQVSPPNAPPAVLALTVPDSPSVVTPISPSEPSAFQSGADAEAPREASSARAERSALVPRIDDVSAIAAVDLSQLLADFDRDIGALELVDVRRAAESDVLSSLSRSAPVDIDTVDLAALFGAAGPNVRGEFIDLAAALDGGRDALEESAALARAFAGGSAGVTTGLSIGYLIWLIRGGTLMGSVLSSLPAWRFVDPLPVLGTLADGVDSESDQEAEGERDSLETLVTGEPLGRRGTGS